VLLGAEFNAAIEEEWPALVREPRILRSRQWSMLADDPGNPGVGPPD